MGITESHLSDAPFDGTTSAKMKSPRHATQEGASGESRTRNPSITNAVLCQLKLRWHLHEKIFVKKRVKLSRWPDYVKSGLLAGTTPLRTKLSPPLSQKIKLRIKPYKEAGETDTNRIIPLKPRSDTERYPRARKKRGTAIVPTRAGKAESSGARQTIQLKSDSGPTGQLVAPSEEATP
jgi:hypothetical protein